MRYRSVALAFLVSLALLADGVEPKPAATDYPAHATVSNVALGAEYLVRSVWARQRSFFLRDYLVVEAAVYPPKGQTLPVSLGQFSLRLNGKKEAIPSQAPSLVAAGLKYPDWQQRPTLEADAGVGNSEVILGRPPAVGRFPGDPSARRLPAPPRAPESNETGVEKEPPLRAEDAVVESAFPEGELTSPHAGYLYFAFKGKTKSIKSVELIYQGPTGTVTLKLF